MSTASERDVEVAIVGAGVVGCATALALARRSVQVAVLESEREPGLCASGTNSGILHTGFDSIPGQLETELILSGAAIRDSVLDALGVPVLRCGALMSPRDDLERSALAAIATRARQNGVPVLERSDGSLEIPGEAVTDPVLYTLALAAAARRHGAELRMDNAVAGLEPTPGGITVRTRTGEALSCALVVNCAGLQADEVARMGGDDSFAIFPRKGEFLVFDPPDGTRLHEILLPIPTKRSKGVLVFPTIDGKIIAGPTAIDQDDKHDWSVRPRAGEEILAKARALHPQLEQLEPVAAYAGLRPAGRRVNYVIGPSRACERLVNVAAIRSTGLSASLGIARSVAAIVGSLGVVLGPKHPLEPAPPPETAGPWWRRTADYRAAMSTPLPGPAEPVSS